VSSVTRLKESFLKIKINLFDVDWSGKRISLRVASSKKLKRHFFSGRAMRILIELMLLASQKD